MPEFVKHDSQKLRWSLLPWGPLGRVVEVLEHGAVKYAPGNWQRCDNPMRYWNAAIRHLASWVQGEKQDPDSGLPHLAHAICSLLFLLWFDENRTQQSHARLREEALERLLSAGADMARILSKKTGDEEWKHSWRQLRDALEKSSSVPPHREDVS